MGKEKEALALAKDKAAVVVADEDERTTEQ